MKTSSFTATGSNGTFSHTATRSFYGTKIDPPLTVDVTYEVHRGRPVFRKAIDRRGVSHEIELLSQNELQETFQGSLMPDRTLLVS